MAKYEHLPVYRAAQEQLNYIAKTRKNFSRYYKYSIGDKVTNEAYKIIRLIIKANNQPVEKRLKTISKAILRTETMRSLFKTLKDEEQLDVKQFSAMSVKNHEILKQFSGWEKYSRAAVRKNNEVKKNKELRDKETNL